MHVADEYSAAAADSISYGTFMQLQLAGKDTADGALGNMLGWLYTNAEFSAAALATELSVMRWADDDQFGFAGDHVWLPGATLRCRLARPSASTSPAAYGLEVAAENGHKRAVTVAAGGNAVLVQALAQEVPVMYSTAVASVDYGGSGVTVTTQDGAAVVADACVMTAPLGVLKAGTIDFQPPLPEAKRQAIARLGCVPALALSCECVRLLMRMSRKPRSKPTMHASTSSSLGVRHGAALIIVATNPMHRDARGRDAWQKRLRSCMPCRFGVLNKVVLLFPHQWWGPHDTFGHVADADEVPGWCYLWYCFPGLSGAPIGPATTLQSLQSLQSPRARTTYALCTPRLVHVKPATPRVARHKLQQSAYPRHRLRPLVPRRRPHDRGARLW